MPPLWYISRHLPIHPCSQKKHPVYPHGVDVHCVVSADWSSKAHLCAELLTDAPTVLWPCPDKVRPPWLRCRMPLQCWCSCMVLGMLLVGSGCSLHCDSVWRSGLEVPKYRELMCSPLDGRLDGAVVDSAHTWALHKGLCSWNWVWSLHLRVKPVTSEAYKS